MKLNKFFLVIYIFIPYIFVSADEAKRTDIIERIKLKELGDEPTLKTISSVFIDSLHGNPYDSICMRQSLRAWDGMNKFIDELANFIVLFPSGTKDFSPKNLPQDKLEKYEYYVNAMRAGLKEYRALIDSVQNFTPYRTRRVYDDYTVNNSNGDVVRYSAAYFFDDEDNLQRYFWFDKLKLSVMSGMIKRAKDHDFTFIEQMADTLGYKLDSKLMVFLMSEGDVEFDNSEIRELAKVNSKRIKRKAKTNSYRSSVISNVSGKENIDNRTNNVKNSIINSSGKKYVVIKKECAATYTNDAMKRFTKFAIDDDYDSIDYMLLSGQLLVLNEGDVVTMVEHGFSLSKVRLSNGRVVITDTSNLKEL